MRVYSSLDVGAPQLPNVDAGNYLFGAILKAVLCDGYGSQPAAGWTCPFTNGAGLWVFKQGGGNQRFFRIDDSQTAMDGNNGRSIYIRGYETMTDANTGTGPFPGALQNNNLGVFLRYRSATHAAGYFPTWEIYADATTVLICVDWVGNPAAPETNLAMAYFGQFDSNQPGDIYNDCVYGASYAVTAGGCYWAYGNVAQMFVTRSHTGVGGSISAGIGSSGPWSQSSTFAGNGNCPYPDPVTNSVLLAKIPVVTATAVMTDAQAANRGFLKWVYDHPHAYTQLGVGTVLNGSGTLAGRTFKVKKSANTNAHSVIVETSNTWS